MTIVRMYLPSVSSSSTFINSLIRAVNLWQQTTATVLFTMTFMGLKQHSNTGISGNARAYRMQSNTLKLTLWITLLMSFMTICQHAPYRRLQQLQQADCNSNSSDSLVSIITHCCMFILSHATGL